MWSMPTLLKILKHINILIVINNPTRVFVAFCGICCILQQMPQFMIVVVACLASLMPLLSAALSSGIDNVQRRSVVIKLQCRGAKKQCKNANIKKMECSFLWMGLEFWPKKELNNMPSYLS